MTTDDSDTCTLVPASEKDAGVLSALHREIIGEHDGWSDSGLKRVLQAAASRGWTAKVRGGAIGFIVAFAAADEAEVLALCVAEGHRRRGVARALLRKLGQQLVAEGTVRLHLEVRASNFAARELYVRNGFIETGRRKGYYRGADGSGAEDAVTMARDLSRPATR